MNAAARFVTVAMLALCSALSAPAALAIDNPDAPDLLGAFQARCEKYQAEIRKQSDTQKMMVAYANYEKFLDAELNKAYDTLLGHVSRDARDSLVSSQRKWLQYRDAEFSFIDRNWTLATFGTSSAISRGDYRTDIVKQRVVMLLRYLKNY